MIKIDRFNAVSVYALCGGMAALLSTTEENMFWFVYLIILSLWSFALAVIYFFEDAA